MLLSETSSAEVVQGRPELGACDRQHHGLID
jgi:hypothetical protein